MSMTRPSPTALPAMLVPAPRPVMGMPAFSAARMTLMSSSLVRGFATTVGTTRYSDESDEYRPLARVDVSRHSSLPRASRKRFSASRRPNVESRGPTPAVGWLARDVVGAVTRPSLPLPTRRSSARPMAVKSFGSVTSTRMRRTAATWLGAASTSRSWPFSVSWASTPRRSSGAERRLTIPSFSIREMVCVSRERVWWTSSAS